MRRILSSSLFHLAPRSLSVAAALLLAATNTPAGVEPLAVEDYWLHRITCDEPVRLTRDCSIWRGATRHIAFGDYRMTIAGGEDGRTLLVSQVRHAPSHNGSRFRTPGKDRGERALRVLDLLNAALSRHGVQLERLQPVRRGQRIAGWFLEFSGDAYTLLEPHTVLESWHWQPRRVSRN